jgi:hypothetical protein
MTSTPGSTNRETPFLREPFSFPSFGNIGPPCISTVSLSRLTIGLLVSLFPTPVISNIRSASNAPSVSNVITPPTHQPHVDLSPSSLVRSPSLFPSFPSEISKASSQVDKKKEKWKEKKKKNQKGTKPPTTSYHVGSKKLTVNRIGSFDKVNKIKTKNPKPKFPCSLCKGNHFLRDFPSLHKVLEIWSSMPPSHMRHASDTSSSSDSKVGKKNRTVKFPCLLYEGDHYSHLFPRMDKASYILEKIQLPTSYRKISPKPSLVDGLVNLFPSSVSLVDQVVNLVSSLVEPQTQVIDPVPSSISPTLHLKSETQVTDPVSSSVSPTLHLKSTKVLNLVSSSFNPTPPLRSSKVVNLILSLVDPTPPLRSSEVVDIVLPSVDPTLHLKSTKVVDMVPYSFDPTPHLRSAKVVDLVLSSIDPTPPLKSSKVVDLVPPLVDPTPPLKSETKLVDPIPPPIDPTPHSKSEDFSHVYLVNYDSPEQGGTPPIPMAPPSSNQRISIDWNHLTEPYLPSYVPFQITVWFCDRNIPNTLIDEGPSVIILSVNSWQDFGSPQLAPVT